MIKKISIVLVLAALSTSCVSKKVYNDLESKYAALKKEQRQLEDQNDELTQAKNKLDLDLKANQEELSRIKAERDKLQNDYTAAANNLKALQTSYAALEKNSERSVYRLT